MGVPSSFAVSATATMSADAAPAQLWLNGARVVISCACRSLPRRATMNRQGCPLYADGAQRAASSAEDSVCSSITAAASYARGLHRRAITSMTGASVVAVRVSTGVLIGLLGDRIG